MPATGRSVNIDLDAGETVTCTFTNTRQAPPSNGTIIIVKDSVPNDPQDFSFAYNVSSGSATLGDDPSSPTPNSFTVKNVAAGTYSVGESQVAGWSLSSIACNDTLAGQDGSDTLTGGTGLTISTVAPEPTQQPISHLPRATAKPVWRRPERDEITAPRQSMFPTGLILWGFLLSLRGHCAALPAEAA